MVSARFSVLIRRGLDQDERDGLNAVIGKLKDELWP